MSMQMQSSNPALAVATRQAGTFNFGGVAQAATIEGTTTRALLYIAITIVAGYFSLNSTINYIFANGAVPSVPLFASILIAFVVAMVLIFKPTLAPIMAPIYAALEGVGLGVLSGVLEFQYPGIVSTAMLATFSVVLVMLAMWKFKLIVPTQKFRSIVMGATMAIALLYIADLLFSMFGSRLLPTSGPLAIGISVVICLVAALNLILDFENIQIAVDQGLPKYFEAFNAFSLLVTICWLYVEILRLLAHLRQE